MGLAFAPSGGASITSYIMQVVRQHWHPKTSTPAPHRFCKANDAGCRVTLLFTTHHVPPFRRAGLPVIGRYRAPLFTTRWTAFTGVLVRLWYLPSAGWQRRKARGLLKYLQAASSYTCSTLKLGYEISWYVGGAVTRCTLVALDSSGSSRLVTLSRPRMQRFPFSRLPHSRTLGVTTARAAIPHKSRRRLGLVALYTAFSRL